MADDVITFKQNAIINKLENMEQERKNGPGSRQDYRAAS